MAKKSVPVPEQGNDRGSFGSNIGFLLSAIGSAVGLGNIWGFPYKMGKSGGFSFLLIYLLLAIFVGFVIMLGELALGRKTGFGPVNAYAAVSKKFKWAGWLGVIVPFLVMTFYSVPAATASTTSSSTSSACSPAALPATRCSALCC